MSLTHRTVLSEACGLKVPDAGEGRPLVEALVHPALAVIVAVEAGNLVVDSWANVLQELVLKVQRIASHARTAAVVRASRTLGAW